MSHSPIPGEEDARSEESFQSADDDDDDFDLPQDIGGPADDTQDFDRGATAAASSGGGALPPGFDDAPDGAGAERWNLRNDGNKEQLEPIWVRLSAEREHVKISKMFSYVLRHAAHKLDVHIRKDGFVRLREIMKLRNFKPYNLEELMAVVYFDEKERYTMVREFDGELLIRANQGHTMKVVEDDLLLEVLTDSSTVNDCVHGTYLVHWPFIKRQGLSKVARNHIHLANGLPEDGKIRGMRSTAELFVYVNVAKAMDDGVVFYRSKNEVILTQGYDGWLPPKYFVKAVRIDYNTCDIEEMEFDTEADVPMWAAELAPSGPGEQGTYLIKNLEALISNCKKRLQEITELKALAEQGQELTDEETHKVTMHAQVYTELQSLEQRFRQHKGYRKESTQDRENRMKEEAEAGTVVKRKDRAVTPPWERGKASALESSAMKATEKEKAEWAALGRRRDSAPTPAAQKEDPWSALGRTRSTPLAGATPSGKDFEFGKKPSFKTGSSFGGRDEGPPRLGREESWRFRGDDGPPLKREESAKLTTPSGSGGPPRFINSKKSDGGSWRDRMSGSQSKDLDDGPSWRKDTSSTDEGPSWRDQMSATPSAKAPAQSSSEAPARSSVPPPPPQAPAPPSINTSMSDGNAAAVPMWQSGQMCGFNSGQGMYYMASPSHQGQDGQMPGTPGSWMRQMPQQMQQQMPQQMQQQMHQQMPQQMHQQMPQQQMHHMYQQMPQQGMHHMYSQLPQQMHQQMPHQQLQQQMHSQMQQPPTPQHMQQQQQQHMTRPEPSAGSMAHTFSQQSSSGMQQGCGAGYGYRDSTGDDSGGGCMQRGNSSSFGGYQGGRGVDGPAMAHQQSRGGGGYGYQDGCGGGDDLWSQDWGDGSYDDRDYSSGSSWRKGAGASPSGQGKFGGGVSGRGGCGKKGGKDSGGKGGKDSGGKSSGRGGSGKDRGDDSQDWAALGRARAAA